MLYPNMQLGIDQYVERELQLARTEAVGKTVGKLKVRIY